MDQTLNEVFQLNIFNELPENKMWSFEFFLNVAKSDFFNTFKMLVSIKNWDAEFDFFNMGMKGVIFKYFYHYYS